MPTLPRVLTLMLAWYSCPAFAHDLWLIPPEKSATSTVTTVRAVSGMKFPKSENVPDPAKFDRLVVMHPDKSSGTLQAAGTDSTAGLLTFKPEKPGVYAVAVVTKPKVIELEADAFNGYLVSDGLPHIYALRAKEKTLDRPAREQYSKSPKTLLKVGSGDGDPCRVVGLPLEIVPTQDPFTRKVGDALRVKVLFRDKPLADANLGWDHPGDGDSFAGTVRTDTKGEALVPIANTGLMTVRLTHMTRPKAKDYEWESFWTSLTFHVPE